MELNINIKASCQEKAQKKLLKKHWMTAEFFVKIGDSWLIQCKNCKRVIVKKEIDYVKAGKKNNRSFSY